MDAHQFADASRGRRSGISGSFHRRHITANNRRYKAGANFFIPDQGDISQL